MGLRGNQAKEKGWDQERDRDGHQSPDPVGVRARETGIGSYGETHDRPEGGSEADQEPARVHNPTPAPIRSTLRPQGSLVPNL